MSDLKPILFLLHGIAQTHDGTLRVPLSLLPLSVQLSTDSEFSKGVLATVLEVYRLISQTSEGRKAIDDLGFEQLFQKHDKPQTLFRRSE